MQDNDFSQPDEQAQPGMPDQHGELAGQQGASPFPDQYGQPGPGQYDPTDPDEYVREHGEGEEDDGEREAAPPVRPVRSVFGGGPQQDDPYGAHNPRTRETEERALDEFIEEEQQR